MLVLKSQNPTAESAERLLRGAWVAGGLPRSDCQLLELISAHHLAGRLDENCAVVLQRCPSCFSIPTYTVSCDPGRRSTLPICCQDADGVWQCRSPADHGRHKHDLAVMMKLETAESAPTAVRHGAT